MTPDTTLSADDPRLTAYALGELDEADRAAVEAALRDQPELREVVGEIRALAGELSSSLAAEPEPAALAAPQREPLARAKVVRFPYFLVSGLAAAAFAVLVAVREEPRRESAEYHRFEVDLGGPQNLRRQGVVVQLPEIAAADAESTVGETYSSFDDNPFQSPLDRPQSTFSVDVDTASYANVRRWLEHGQRPPREAVRIEELVNYFPYDYPADANSPLAVHLEVASAPWAPDHRLVRIGLKATAEAETPRGAANLVFLLDVSGSMAGPQRLPLVKDAMRLLLGQLEPEDRVAIVTYAGESGLVLPPTRVADGGAILAALESLQPGGATSGASGIHLAYEVAKANFVEGGINRVVLCTDGDFNVGPSTPGELARLVEEEAQSEVYLTALGFGMGNYRDDMLERLAQHGQGAYGYVDSLREARKLLVEQVEGTLRVAARDVKVQVEFNPGLVQSYRLIGYENRLLRADQFEDDAADAGEMGHGHTVTALYEVVPVVSVPRWTELGTAGRDPLVTVKVGYKRPAEGASRRIEVAAVDPGHTYRTASTDFRFAAAVAGFGLVLRDSAHRGTATLQQVTTWAQEALGEDRAGHRAEFVRLAGLARDLHVN